MIMMTPAKPTSFQHLAAFLRNFSGLRPPLGTVPSSKACGVAAFPTSRSAGRRTSSPDGSMLQGSGHARSFRDRADDRASKRPDDGKLGTMTSY